MIITGYKKYANEEAFELAVWSIELLLEENGDRIKASKIKKIADKMEDKYKNTKKYKRKQHIAKQPGCFSPPKKDLMLEVGLGEPPPIVPTRSEKGE